MIPILSWVNLNIRCINLYQNRREISSKCVNGQVEINQRRLRRKSKISMTRTWSNVFASRRVTTENVILVAFQERQNTIAPENVILQFLSNKYEKN